MEDGSNPSIYVGYFPGFKMADVTGSEMACGENRPDAATSLLMKPATCTRFPAASARYPWRATSADDMTEATGLSKRADVPVFATSVNSVCVAPGQSVVSVTPVPRNS